MGLITEIVYYFIIGMTY